MKLSKALSLSLLPVASYAAGRGPITYALDAKDQIVALGRGAVRTVLTDVLKMNATAVERMMTKQAEELPEHPIALDVTDENFETVLRTGTYNSLASSLPEDSVWVIHVHGPDPVSKMLGDAFDAVAAVNSSQAGGSLPSNLHFARVSYLSSTIVPTRFWLWKPPVLVIASNHLRELRFFRVGEISPHQLPLSNLLNQREVWETMPVWKGALAPGGWFEPFLVKIARVWAIYHSYLSRVPNFVLLIISGMIMNIVVNWFHKPEASAANHRAPSTTAQTASQAEKSTTSASSTTTTAKGRAAEVRKRK